MVGNADNDDDDDLSDGDVGYSERDVSNVG